MIHPLSDLVRWIAIEKEAAERNAPLQEARDFPKCGLGLVLQLQGVQ